MALKDLTKMIQNAQKENEMDAQFLADLTIAIKRNNAKNSRKPSKYFKPSSIGGCRRNIFYQRTEKEQDPSSASMELVGMGESGTDRHERLQNHIMTMEDWEWVDVEHFLKSRPDSGTKVVKKIGNEYKCFNEIHELSFLVDGILKHKKTGQYIILEIKTEASFKWNKRFEPDPKHIDQATACHLALGISKLIFLYENRDFCNKKAFLVDVTQELEDKVLATIRIINQHIELNTLPDKTNVIKECKYCNYKTACKNDLI